MLEKSEQRQQLLSELHRLGIRDERLLAVLEQVPRERFVDESFQKHAYDNRALPIGMGQTISQPLMVAVMTQALRLEGQERVLEIGTGSGYQTAILASLAAHVYSVERYEELALLASARLKQLSIGNVSLYVADGSLGLPEQAPFDRILVTAAAPKLPERLFEQLTMKGLLVVPVGEPERQELQVVQRTPAGRQVQSLGSCVFVPLVGEGGWCE